jgi:hypothetical protein
MTVWCLTEDESDFIGAAVRVGGLHAAAVRLKIIVRRFENFTSKILFF